MAGDTKIWGFNVPFFEAILFAVQRGVVLPSEYYGRWPAMDRVTSTTVSGLTSLLQIQHVIDKVNAAVADGTTLQQFQERIANDPAVADDVMRLPKNRLEVIFRNNVQTAYQGGRWDQIQQNKERRPYVMFSGINDARQTAVCRRLDGIIRPADDPFWRSHSPLLHHQCRSSLIPLSEQQAQHRSAGRNGLHKPIPTDVAPDPGFGGNPLEGLPTLTTMLNARAEDMPLVARQQFRQKVNAILKEQSDGLKDDAIRRIRDEIVALLLAKNVDVGD